MQCALMYLFITTTSEQIEDISLINFYDSQADHYGLFFTIFVPKYTANILTVLSTAFGSVAFPTVIWLCMLQPKTAIDLKLYFLMGTVVGCDNHCQITVENVT